MDLHIYKLALGVPLVTDVYDKRNFPALPLKGPQFVDRVTPTWHHDGKRMPHPRSGGHQAVGTT